MRNTKADAANAAGTPVEQSFTIGGKRFFTPEQAREYIGRDLISRLTVYELIRRGDIQHVKVGTRYFIPAEPFVAWLSGKRAQV